MKKRVTTILLVIVVAATLFYLPFFINFSVAVLTAIGVLRIRVKQRLKKTGCKVVRMEKRTVSTALS